MAVMAVMVVACADDTTNTTIDGSGTTTTTTTTTIGGSDTTTTSEPGTTVPGEADHQLTIDGFAFSGPSTVSVGDTILVTNEDSFPHTWTSDDGGWTSGTLSTGSTFFYTFEEAGTFDYFCGIHSEMTGSITVEG